MEKTKDKTNLQKFTQMQLILKTDPEVKVMPLK